MRPGHLTSPADLPDPAQASRALAWLCIAADTLPRGTPAVYEVLTEALRELVGFKLMTLLRLEHPHLVREHSSDLAAYPPGGRKDITHDAWLQQMLNGAQPVVSPDADAVRAHFFDHAAIFALGCESALNLPVTGADGRVLGSLNLLHQAHWYGQRQAQLALPFVPLLAACWAAPRG